MREIKFRAWDKEESLMMNVAWITFPSPENGYVFGHFEKDGQIKQKESKNIVLMQYTGLKDKNGLTDIYEGDIINSEGNVKGNIYENNLDKKETDIIIQGFGTKTWCETYNKAILLGCYENNNFSELIK